MQPFRPYPGKPTVMPYYELSIDVLEDEEALRGWVAEAIRAAVAAQAAKTRRGLSIKR